MRFTGAGVEKPFGRFIATWWLDLRCVLLLLLLHDASAGAPSSRLLENRDGQSRAFTGIGRLSLSTNCTTFFIRTPGGGSAAAYALSAGHCYSISPNEVFVNQTLPPGTRSVRFRYFADTQDQQVSVPISRIAYSTMRGWDIAVVELAATVADLQSRGLTPLQIEPLDPSPGDSISIVGAPASNFPSADQFLRQSHCTLGERVDLIEFVWHFWSARRNDCEDIVGGVSGSPVISERTGNVVGIVNTTTHLAFHSGGDFDCYAGRPCEIGRGTQRVEEETSYSIPVTGLLACFSPDGAFAPDRGDCPLPRATPRVTVNQPARSRRPGTAWNATVSGDVTHYRYKATIAGAGDCRDSAGYSEPILREARSRIEDRLPETENRHLLCVIVGNSANADHPSWQLPGDATVAIGRTDATPPVIESLYSVTRNNAGVRIAFEFLTPELSGYEYKFGTPEGTRCSDPGYRPYLRIPVTVPADGGPIRFCFYGTDDADNARPALDLILGDGPVILPAGVTHAPGFRPDAFAPGQWVSIYGLNIEQALPRLRAAGGGEQPLEIGYASPNQINARLPRDAASGPAQIVLRERAEPIRIAPLSPGIFLAEQVSGNDILVYTTGLAAARMGDLRAWIGRLELAVLSSGDAGFPGVEVVRVRLPDGSNLRGRQFVQLTTGSIRSNRREVILH